MQDQINNPTSDIQNARTIGTTESPKPQQGSTKIIKKDGTDTPPPKPKDEPKR